MTIERLINTYQQAPWRTQRQFVGVFLAVLTFITMVSGLYLNITAQATLLGREIQYLRADIVKVEQQNATLETELAELRSFAVLNQRARAMGFYPLQPGEVKYLAVPGYHPPLPINLAPGSAAEKKTGLPGEYTQSLWEWFEIRMISAAYNGGAR